MSIMNSLRFGYLAYLSKPQADRTFYRLLRKQPVRSIVEMGIGSGVRTRRMFEVLQQYHSGEKIRYTGIDPFELRPEGSPRLSLKQAFTTLSMPNVKLQLLPGDPFMALSRAANGLKDTDLVIISADQTGEALDRAWFYLPRMLHEGSQVFLEQPGAKPEDTEFRAVTRLEVERLASTKHQATRRAA